MKTLTKSRAVTVLLLMLVANHASAEMSFIEKARTLAKSASQKLNVPENMALVDKLRNGGMPPHPADGGCVTSSSKAVISDFLRQRRHYAELAEYARLVYERENLQSAVTQSRLDQGKRVFQNVNFDRRTSLGYMLVEQPGASGETDVTLVFEGSTYKHGRVDALKKFVNTDFAQLVSTTTPEMFRAAEEVYLNTLAKYPPSTAGMTLTGHSLGGALATYLGLKYGARTVTFNPARLSTATVNDAARRRPEVLDNGMRNVTNITHISSSTDTVHFMGLPGQATYLPGASFIFKVVKGDATGHGMHSLSTALHSIAQRTPEADEMCASYYGNDAAWSALKANVEMVR